MSTNRALLAIGIAILIALPFVTSTYVLHLVIQILIWAFIYTAWPHRGRSRSACCSRTRSSS